MSKGIFLPIPYAMRYAFAQKYLTSDIYPMNVEQGPNLKYLRHPSGGRNFGWDLDDILTTSAMPVMALIVSYRW